MLYALLIKDMSIFFHSKRNMERMLAGGRYIRPKITIAMEKSEKNVSLT